MTLDEAIRHAEEVAEENQAIVDSCDYYGENMTKCEKCAEEHRQLAEWLRDYKRLKEQESKTEQFAKWVATEIFDDDWEYNKETFAELACRKLAKLGIVIRMSDEWELVEPQESDHKCHTCKHYTSGKNDGSCGSYICEHYSNWESEDNE